MLGKRKKKRRHPSPSLRPDPRSRAHRTPSRAPSAANDTASAQTQAQIPATDPAPAHTRPVTPASLDLHRLSITSQGSPAHPQAPQDSAAVATKSQYPPRDSLQPQQQRGTRAALPHLRGSREDYLENHSSQSHLIRSATHFRQVEPAADLRRRVGLSRLSLNYHPGVGASSSSHSRHHPMGARDHRHPAGSLRVVDSGFVNRSDFGFAYRSGRQRPARVRDENHSRVTRWCDCLKTREGSLPDAGAHAGL